MYVCPWPEAQLSTCLVTVKDEDVDGITDRGCACFQEKYYLGYVLLGHLSIATDIQFHNYFQLSNLLAIVIYEKSL